ncbi:MAG: pyrroloquinoline quinone biosynthesis protein PqqE [Spirochaetaceae bacterium]|nr:pyrroloquinoline quinone biosynthesis protein PqqE [Myxococcales bacterium]MCB9726491.1 pyrroloquinoline quinone biosynthesis protein PqqE [Spirochaetaceae bacterium]
MSAYQPVLSRHASLKSRPEGDVLVLPERAVRLGGSGGEILRLCGGGRSVKDIVDALEARYSGTPRLELSDEVRRFLAEMQSLGGVESADVRSGGEDPSGVEAGPRDAAVVPPTPTRRLPTATADEGPLETSSATRAVPAPLNLIAELTYRCPLQCAYCSNPLDFRSRREALGAEDWGRVFEQASRLGVVHLGLTGGEPSTRADLEEIVDRAFAADLYPHLVTAGLPLTPERLEALARRGLRSVQVSFQDATPAASDAMAGTESFERKRAIGKHTVALGLSLTLNCVLHRQNLASVPALIELALELGADRLELANTQYHGWAYLNRGALMPTRDQLDRASEAVRGAEERAKAAGLTMLFVRPDYFTDRPKPCMGGWGRLAMVVDPTGCVLPCHDAVTIPGLEFWNVREHSVAKCWHEAPGMSAYRGFEWMRDPCRACPERERDFGGCRCQAFRIAGDAAATDPACALSAHHGRIVAAREPDLERLVPRR